MNYLQLRATREIAMNHGPARIALNYGVAILAVAIATASHFWLNGLLQSQPFTPFFVAVLFVAALRRAGPVLLATTLSVVAVAPLLEPIGSFTVALLSDRVELATFSAIGIGLAALTETTRRLHQRAMAAQAQLVQARARELVEASRLANEAFLRGILDSLPHEIAVIDRSGAVLALNEPWNLFARENNGGPSVTSVGLNYLGAIRAAADAGDACAHEVLDGLLALLADERLDYTIEYSCRTPSQELWFVMHAARADCAPAAVVISHTNITQRKSAERRLHEATEKLREADVQKDQFLATLAHELRNPLASIRNAVHALRRDLPLQLARESHGLELLSMVDRQVTHLARLVDDLLDVSRITRGKIELNKQPIDLANVLRDAIEMAQPIIQRGGHTLKISLPEKAILVDGDPVRLTQVFSNLLNNAAKYTEEGGTIWLVAEPQGAEAVITVRDSGVGIPAEMLPRVFDLFTQVDRTLGRAQGGLGIGLALVKRLLELHGGTVEAHSEGSGQGSTFVVRLSALPEASIAEIKEDAPMKLQTARRILIIEDDADVADSLRMLLEIAGAVMRVAYSGARGLEVLPEFNPDLVLLDLGMPGMDGYEVARQIRALPHGRNVKLVALTGWGREQVFEHARAAGFDDQITKPASLEKIRQLLEEPG